MTGQQITPAVRAAVDAARRAMEGLASPHGPAETIVLALADMQLLQDPETAAELVRLRTERASLNDVLAGGDEERGLLRERLAELQPYEALHPQFCDAGQHRSWFADASVPVPCPWCEIARAQESARQHGRGLGGDRMQAPACPVSGCGSSAVYLNTSTARASGWVEVRTAGGAAAMSHWYCSALCVALATGGDQVEVAVRTRLAAELDAAAAALIGNADLDYRVVPERHRGLQTARRIVQPDHVDADAARCQACGCTQDDACSGGCAWAPGMCGLCTACAPPVPCTTEGCGTPAEEWDGSDPKLWGWICLYVGGSDTRMRWVCSALCATEAIDAGGAELAAGELAASAGGDGRG